MIKVRDTYTDTRPTLGDKYDALVNARADGVVHSVSAVELNPPHGPYRWCVRVEYQPDPIDTYIEGLSTAYAPAWMDPRFNDPEYGT